MRELLRRDVPLLLPMGVLIGLGWVMVFSTGTVLGVEGATAGVFMHLKRQVLATGLGAIGLLVASRTPLGRLRALAPRLFVGAAVLMLVVFVPGVGRSVARARRWINLGFLSFQPVEVFKLAVVLCYARLLGDERPDVPWTWEAWGRVAGLAAVSLLLTIVQRDFGSTVLLLALAGMMLFLAGARRRALAGFALTGAAAAAALLVAAPYRLHRLQLFLSSWTGGQEGGYQTRQSLIAIGSGGLTGVGLGESAQKLLYLPSAHADFIFAIIGEELGFLGAFLTAALYFLLLREGLAIARRSPTRFGRLFAAGLSLLLIVQALWHIGVALVLLPTKGLALPFVSYGGSSLMASMTAVGLLLRCAGEGPAADADAPWRSGPVRAPGTGPAMHPGGRAWAPW